MDYDKLLENYSVEIKRGTLTLAVLSQLDQPQYGYSLLETLTAYDVPIESGTLYPLLRRLEKQGLLTSEWNTEESRPRKFYSRSDLGDMLFLKLREEWQEQTKQLNRLLEEPYESHR